jgi:hypothetical protein
MFNARGTRAIIDCLQTGKFDLKAQQTYCEIHIPQLLTA